eukprot:TRINITY_DN12079_c0_g1_i1.p1 TRINITY_DN12079_c0_g1~~TRINITY_DN12079_c0_g1_i1.p1  ORF type:complete len:248 (+),score=49.88 TRINITY_DN12079_c0_g1_i1:92-745(+)
MESNPEVMTKFVGSIGVDTTAYQFADVWSLDEEMWSFLPNPLVSLILLRPSSAKSELDESLKGSDDVFHLSQIDALDEACGSIACVHILANKINQLQLSQESLLVKYVQSCTDANSMERGETLASNTDLYELHSEYSQQGDTDTIAEGESSNHHFLAFFEHEGNLYELDGCKPFPLNHGPIESSFIATASNVIKTLYITDPSQVDFSLIAFGGPVAF